MRQDQRDETSVSNIIPTLKLFVSKNVRWILRALTITVIVIFFLNEFAPEYIAIAADKTGINEEHLLLTLCLVLLINIFERQLALEEQAQNTSITSHETEATAYRYLSNLIERRSVQRIDMVQVSGQTALLLLEAIFRTQTNVHVRLLLAHRDVAAKFDKDPDSSSVEYFNHMQRIDATISQVKTFKKRGSRSRIEIRYYRSYPGVCSVRMDNAIVCLGWYRTFFDASEIMRVRSHNVPAVVVLDKSVEPFLSFVKLHFEKLWQFSELEPESRKLTTLHI